MLTDRQELVLGRLVEEYLDVGVPVGSKSLSTALDGEGDLHIDLSYLEFCDVSGIRALVAAAESVSGRRRLVLHGLPPQLRTVMTVVGWTDLPGLAIDELGAVGL